MVFKVSESVYLVIAFEIIILNNIVKDEVIRCKIPQAVFPNSLPVAVIKLLKYHLLFRPTSPWFFKKRDFIKWQDTYRVWP